MDLHQWPVLHFIAFFLKRLLVVVVALVAQWCLILCDPMDCSPPGSSVHGDSPGKSTGLGCHCLLQFACMHAWVYLDNTLGNQSEATDSGASVTPGPTWLPWEMKMVGGEEESIAPHICNPFMTHSEQLPSRGSSAIACVYRYSNHVWFTLLKKLGAYITHQSNVFIKRN